MLFWRGPQARGAEEGAPRSPRRAPSSAPRACGPLQNSIVILLQLDVCQGLTLHLVLLRVKLGLEVLPLPAHFVEVRCAQLTGGLEQVLQVRADVLDSLVRLLQERSLGLKVPLVSDVGAVLRSPLRKK